MTWAMVWRGGGGGAHDMGDYPGVFRRRRYLHKLVPSPGGWIGRVAVGWVVDRVGLGCIELWIGLG